MHYLVSGDAQFVVEVSLLYQVSVLEWLIMRLLLADIGAFELDVKQPTSISHRSARHQGLNQV